MGLTFVVRPVSTTEEESVIKNMSIEYWLKLEGAESLESFDQLGGLYSLSGEERTQMDEIWIKLLGLQNLEKLKKLESLKLSDKYEVLKNFEPVTEADKALISAYKKRLATFDESHCYVVQDISEEQQKSYIIGHRGGVVFPGTNGMSSTDLQDYAVQVLSALKEGRYKRKDGQSYPYESFREDVRIEVKENLKQGWVKRTDDLSGYRID